MSARKNFGYKCCVSAGHGFGRKGPDQDSAGGIPEMSHWAPFGGQRTQSLVTPLGLSSRGINRGGSAAAPTHVSVG